MICPVCGNQVSQKKRYCEACGYDLTLYRRIYRLSAQYYNKGLERAKVRDLTGAVILLKRSLELNKRNTDARNLLGLIYFEQGETVYSISEWVISKHFQPNGNAADEYMDMIQNNPVKLDSMNQAIKKYNLALEAAKQGTDDLAILQLKKVIGMHPNFIRAMLLLSLLYIKTQEIERAKRLLQRILTIDVSNTMALRYLTELKQAENSQEPLEHTGTEPSFAVPAVFREEIEPEEKPNVMAFVGLIAGILIGIAVVFFIIVPGRETQIRDEYLAQQIDYSEKLNSKIAQINSLQTKISALESKNEELLRNLNETETRVEYVPYENPVHAQLFAELFDAVRTYADYSADKKIKDREGQEIDEDLCLKVANALVKVDITTTENEEAKRYYQKMCDEILPDAASFAYKRGKELYDSGRFEDAVTHLEAANRYSPDYDRPIYYLGRSYQEMRDNEKAITYFELLLSTCPESSLAGYATERINALREE